MKIGRVIASVQTARRAQCLQEQNFLIVRCGDEELVAADRVGAAPGDRVLLATGAAASRYSMEAPVDAAAVAVVEEKEAHSP